MNESSNAHRESPPRRLQILLADDDASVRRCVTRYLSRLGYSVTAVTDGKEAWDAIRSGHYDLLITDQQMHNANGAELILQLRLAGKTLPVIVAASDLQPFDEAACQDLMVAVIQKPFGLDKLGHAIALALSPTSDQFRGQADARNAGLHARLHQAQHDLVLS